MDVMAATEILARSTTTTGVGLIGYIIIGGLAGWIGSKIVKGGGSGILLDIVIGVVGALLGGFILSFFVNTAGGGANTGSYSSGAASTGSFTVQAGGTYHWTAIYTGDTNNKGSSDPLTNFGTTCSLSTLGPPVTNRAQMKR